MPRPSRILVRTAQRAYPLLLGRGHAAASLKRLLARRPRSVAVVITSRPVWSRVETRLSALAPRPTVFLPDRERAKTWRQIASIHDNLLASRIRRDGLIVAVGGGSLGDAAGFAAATYMRGIDWIVVPTTLLSMVDSAVGGKVGVNHPRSKNLIGAFHQPLAVVIDIDLLKTLPRRELRSGAYEILKCALIGDRRHFDELRHRGPADTWSPRLIRRAVAAAVRLKAAVVSKDERERGPRGILNLGHTMGHALESATGYRRFTHGEAVGWGIVAAARISLGRGLLRASQFASVVAAVGGLGPLPSLRGIDYHAIRAAVHSDKKARSGQPTFILPAGLGRVVVRDDITEAELRAAWRFLHATENYSRKRPYQATAASPRNKAAMPPSARNVPKGRA